MNDQPHPSYPVMTPDEYKAFQKECMSGKRFGRISGYMNIRLDKDGVVSYSLIRYEYHV